MILPLSNTEIKELEDEGYINELQSKLIKDKRDKVLVIEQTQKYNCCEKTIYNNIIKIKKMYDQLSREYPEKYHKRKI